MASVTREDEFPEPELRPMHELDVPVVVTIERSSYQFPWSEGIFRDCLRVGYVCRVVEVEQVTVRGGYERLHVGSAERGSSSQHCTNGITSHGLRPTFQGDREARPPKRSGAKRAGKS